MTPADAASVTQDFKGPRWERDLRVHLATMCMAVLSMDKGDLREATDNVVSFVRNLVEK